MSVFLTHGDFRSGFSKSVTYTPSAPDPLQFTAPNLITITSGTTWASLGFLEGMRIQPIGTTSNDLYFFADDITGSVITTVDNNVTTEGPITAGVVVNGAQVDNDALERWPIEDVRAGGFGAISNFTVPYNGLAMLVTANALAADAVFNVDDFNWYLSQRSDVPANQYWTITQLPSIPAVSSFSGTMRIIHTALAETEFGVVAGNNLTPDQTVSLFKDMHLYVQRLSDGAIQFTDMLQEQVSSIQ